MKLAPKILSLALVGLVAATVPGTSIAERPAAPESHQPAVATLVGALLSSEHFEGRPLDDELSERWLDLYLQQLDYNRMIFLEEDIAEFKAYEHQLDDLLSSREPRLQVPFLVHERFTQRVQERVEDVAGLLEEPITLDGTETWDLDRSDEPWPASREQARELWRKRIKEQVLRGDLQGKERAETLDMLRKRYQRMAKDLEVSEPIDVLEPFLSALAQAYDPHSAYFKPATNDNFDIQMSNSLEGIGATLRTEGEYTLVVSLVPGGPAQMQGELKAGDKIISVAQGQGAPVDVIDQRIDHVVKLIRGPKGTDVRLTVIPVDATDPSHTQEITIRRDEVTLTANDADARVLEVPGLDGGTVRVGIIDVPSFYLDFDAKRQGDPDYKSTTRDVRRLLENLQQQEVAGIILDLRQNGGGALSEAVELAGLFIDRGPIVQVGDKRGRVEPLYDPDPRQVYDGPVMVLTSPLSASASEIVAAAIQDYGRGIVVGSSQTHGKGTVQNVIDLDPLMARIFDVPDDAAAGALKVTTNKFYRISGGSTQLRGVASDVVIPSPYDGLDVLESDLEYALGWDKVGPVPYRQVADLGTDVTWLRDRSARRIAESEEFRELKEEIARRAGDDDTVSLNLEVRRKEMEQSKHDPLLSAAAEEPTTEEEEPEYDDENDFVLQEAGRVLRDWVSRGRFATAEKG